jgi:enoyl-CoA hydratase
LDEQLVVARRDGPIARLSLNRPGKHNAMNRTMLTQLEAAVSEADKDADVRIIVINGNGPSFSSGHDMKESQEDPQIAEARETTEGRWAFEYETYYRYSLNIRNTRKPTIAQIHGSCFAAGLMLVAMCDLAIASEESRFGVPVLRFGLASGEMAYEVWELGARRAKEFLFTGDTIDAVQATEWGLINRVVSRAELDEKVTELALKIAAQPPFALSMLKASINHTLDAMGQSNSFWQHFLAHHLTHSTDEALGESRRRREEGKATWALGQKQD